MIITWTFTYVLKRVRESAREREGGRDKSQGGRARWGVAEGTGQYGEMVTPYSDSRILKRIKPVLALFMSMLHANLTGRVID